MFAVKSKKFLCMVVSFVLMFVGTLCLYNNNASATNNRLFYLKYDYTTNKQTMYILNQVPYQDNTRVSVVDNRVPDKGNTSVVYLNLGGGWGSGFIVAKNVIATAAHCVYDHGTKQFTPNIAVTICNDNANNGLPAIPVVSAHVPKKYSDYSNDYQFDCYDYALLYLGEDVDLTQYGIMSLGVPLDSFIENETDGVYVSGFPGSLNGDQVPANGVRYKSEGSMIPFIPADNDGTSVDKQRARELRFSASCVMSPGDSGGPLYYTTNSYNGNGQVTAIGIATGGGWNKTGQYYINTSGVRITTDLLHFYLNNDNL